MNGVTDYWGASNRAFGVMEKRATGQLPPMEAANALANFVKDRFGTGETVLDAACGVGHFLPVFEAFMPRSKYTGLDISTELITSARRLFPDVKFIEASVETIPAEDGAFDHVVCVNTLMHVANLRIAIAELLRVTRKHLYLRMLVGDHTLLIRHVQNQTSHPWSSKTNAVDELDENNEPRDYHNFNIYSRAFVEGLLTDLGASRFEVIPDTFFDPAVFAREAGHKSPLGTRIAEGRQVIGNIICPWTWVIIDK